MEAFEEKSQSIRVMLPASLYVQLKAECLEHGEMSQLIRKLITNYLKGLEKA